MNPSIHASGIVVAKELMGPPRETFWLSAWPASVVLTDQMVACLASP